jgi:hypothetical protein
MPYGIYQGDIYMKANRKEALQETAKDETLGVRRKPQASSDASTSGSATEVAFNVFLHVYETSEKEKLFCVCL